MFLSNMVLSLKITLSCQESFCTILIYFKRWVCPFQMKSSQTPKWDWKLFSPHQSHQACSIVYEWFQSLHFSCRKTLLGVICFHAYWAGPAVFCGLWIPMKIHHNEPAFSALLSLGLPCLQMLREKEKARGEERTQTPQIY